MTKISEIKKTFQALIAKWGQIDSIIFLPGIYEPQTFDQIKAKSVRAHYDINVFGLFNVIEAVLPQLVKQHSGQLCICSSVAGFMGLPNGQPYSSTKAAVTNIAESLKAENPFLDIKVIHPGFMKTRLTAKNKFKMPFVIEADKAAEHIIKGMQKSAFEIAFPFIFLLLLKITRLLPYSLYFRFFMKS